MTELVILMLETEQPEGLSARKLVVETAKHNVITAYCPSTGLDLLRRFPAVNAVLVHSALIDQRPTLLSEVRDIAPHARTIVACPTQHAIFEQADWVVDSHQPQQLLNLLVREFHVSARSDNND